MSSRPGRRPRTPTLWRAQPRTVQTRIFRGRTIDEVIPQIQRELGADAIIVRRREGLSGGVLGFFQHPFVEIEAMPGGPRIDVYDEEVPPSPLEDLLPPAPERAPPAPSAPPPPPAPPAPAAPAARGARQPTSPSTGAPRASPSMPAPT